MIPHFVLLLIFLPVLVFGFYLPSTQFQTQFLTTPNRFAYQFTPATATATALSSTMTPKQPSPETPTQTPTPVTNSTVLSSLITSRKTFELNLARSIDILTSDYPTFLTTPPDLSIYHPQIILQDASGSERVSGIDQYQNVFKVFRGFVALTQQADQSSISSRVVYDWGREEVRVKFSCVLVPRGVQPHQKHMFIYLDGVSRYKFDAEGKITRHIFDKVIINDQKVRPPYGFMNPEMIFSPVGAGGAGVWSSDVNGQGDEHEQFMMMEANNDDELLIEKNSARQKFGLPPISLDELLKLRSEEGAVRSAFEERLIKQQQKGEEAKEDPALQPNLLDKAVSSINKFFSPASSAKCVDSYDCPSNLNCCDFVFAKVCCKSGLGIQVFPTEKMVEMVPALIPVEDSHDGHGNEKRNGGTYGGAGRNTGDW